MERLTNFLSPSPTSSLHFSLSLSIYLTHPPLPPSSPSVFSFLQFVYSSSSGERRQTWSRFEPLERTPAGNLNQFSPVEIFFFWNFCLKICGQYCRVPKNGLPKNGQAGISSKNKNDPRLENWVKNGFTTRKQRLLWRRLLQRHCWLWNDSTPTGRNISAPSPARHVLPAWQHRYRVPCRIYVLSYVMWLEDGSKNKNEIGWSREK